MTLQSDDTVNFIQELLAIEIPERGVLKPLGTTDQSHNLHTY